VPALRIETLEVRSSLQDALPAPIELAGGQGCNFDLSQRTGTIVGVARPIAGLNAPRYPMLDQERVPDMFQDRTPSDRRSPVIRKLSGKGLGHLDNR
jgi:hypothetical protein